MNEIERLLQRIEGHSVEHLADEEEQGDAYGAAWQRVQSDALDSQLNGDALRELAQELERADLDFALLYLIEGAPSSPIPNEVELVTRPGPNGARTFYDRNALRRDLRELAMRLLFAASRENEAIDARAGMVCRELSRDHFAQLFNGLEAELEVYRGGQPIPLQYMSPGRLATIMDSASGFSKSTILRRFDDERWQRHGSDWMLVGEDQQTVCRMLRRHRQDT